MNRCYSLSVGYSTFYKGTIEEEGGAGGVKKIVLVFIRRALQCNAKQFTVGNLHFVFFYSLLL